jgi:pimeloyl-ACP methyl ester carboxylesterase
MRIPRIIASLALPLNLLYAPQVTSPVSNGWRDPSPHSVKWVTVERTTRLEVLDWGGSGRPVVLLGCYLTAHVYDDFAPKLTKQFHVYGVTRRGLGASDKPPTGYSLERSAQDVLDVLNALNLRKPILVGYACAGSIVTFVGSRSPDRIGGLVYFDAADDPTLTNADYEISFPDASQLPRSVRPGPAPDYTSFGAYRDSQRRDHGVAFPEAELRQQFSVNADGSVGSLRMSSAMRATLTESTRVKPTYSRIHVPVLAIYRQNAPFEDFAADYVIRNEQERSALRQQYDATAAMITRWQRELRAGVPTARIVNLVGANLYMFLSNEVDVLREISAFGGTIADQ